MPRIYTKAGDDGTTGLLYGGRISKAHPAAEAYGSVDEAVAALGLARSLSSSTEVAALILRLERELFVVGADLATNPDERDKLAPGVSLVTADMAMSLEEIIDRTVAEHPLPQQFIVPGATAASGVSPAALRTASTPSDDTR